MRRMVRDMAANSYYTSHPAYIPPPSDEKDEATHRLLSPDISSQVLHDCAEHQPPENQYMVDQQHQYLLSSPAPSQGYLPDLQPGQLSGQNSPLRPFHLKGKMDHSHAHIQKNASYDDGTPSLSHSDEIYSIQKEDEKLEARIRHLRIVSRILALLISIAVLVPITLTLHKFLTTRDIFHDVSTPTGTMSRTAWAKNSKVWPTYMYFGVACVSVVLNFVIIFSYKFGVKYANKASVVASTFSWIVMAGNLIVWSVAASLYRTERDKNGKSNDLWGWTCSPAAMKIQKEFAGEVNFNNFCNIQSISWYIGLVQVAASALTIVTYVLAYMRRKSKKNLKRAAFADKFEGR